MDKKDIVKYLAQQDPADILCLGSRTGLMSSTLNTLEEKYKEKYNKTTVYASKYKTLDKKILYLISLETGQKRYITQVNRKLIEDDSKRKLESRLSEVLSCQDDSQQICEIQFAKNKNVSLAFSIVGYADAIKENTVYELKFVTELTHEHFLQCACYVVARKLKRGVLWNTRTNEMYEISIVNRNKFLDAVASTITKRQITKYYKPKGILTWLGNWQ